jgi:single-strand DNA-binding protein
MINTVILIGNLGRDPEVGETPGGQRFARLSVATSDEWRDKASGEKRERTEWHRVVAWGDGLASMLAKHAQKGSKVYVSGKLATREWADKAGAKRFTTEVVVQGPGASIRLLSGSAGSGGVPAPDEVPEGAGMGREPAYG